MCKCSVEKNKEQVGKETAEFQETCRDLKFLSNLSDETKKWNENEISNAFVYGKTETARF